MFNSKVLQDPQLYKNISLDQSYQTELFKVVLVLLVLLFKVVEIWNQFLGILLIFETMHKNYTA